MKSIFIGASLAGFAQSAQDTCGELFKQLSSHSLYEPWLFRQPSHGDSIYEFPGVARSESSYSEPGSDRTSGSAEIRAEEIQDKMLWHFKKRIEVVQTFQRNEANNTKAEYVRCNNTLDYLMRLLNGVLNNPKKVNQVAEKLSKAALQELGLEWEMNKISYSAKALDNYRELGHTKLALSSSNKTANFEVQLPEPSKQLRERLSRKEMAMIYEYRSDIDRLTEEVLQDEHRLVKRKVKHEHLKRRIANSDAKKERADQALAQLFEGTPLNDINTEGLSAAQITELETMHAEIQAIEKETAALRNRESELRSGRRLLR